MIAHPPPGTPIVLDIGSAYVKLGFAGESSPKHVFPCITGIEKYKAVMVDVNARNIYVGNDAMKMRGVLKVIHPIQRGVIMDWDGYYEILNHIFYTLLRIENLNEYPILYVENLFVQRETKEYIARLLFETHRVGSLIMVPSPLLSIFSVGLTTGLVIESGDGITWIVPIINGQIYLNAVQRLELAGEDVNHSLKSLLMREGIIIVSSAVDEILRDLKEKNCYFALDPRNPPKVMEDYDLAMPDGSSIKFPARILYEAPEILFHPELYGSNSMSIPQAVISCLKSMDSKYWSKLLSHIVLSGGNSYSGFEERLKTELKMLLPQLGQIPKDLPGQISNQDISMLEVEIEIKNEIKKLQSLDISKIKEDNCPHCGILVDLSDDKEFCPSCKRRIGIPRISIDVDESKNDDSLTMVKVFCPHCNKPINDDSSKFCPYCGENIMEPGSKPSFEMPAGEFSGHNDLSEEIIKFFVPDNLQFAIYNGASILGSLPSFRSLFITHDQFRADNNVLYVDISTLFEIGD